MNVLCKKFLAKEGIEILDFSKTEELKIFTLTVQSAIQAVKHLIDNNSISLALRNLQFCKGYSVAFSNKTLCLRQNNTNTKLQVS